MTERFQSRTVASFSAPQLERILHWTQGNGVNSNDGFTYQRQFRKFVESSDVDEKGRPIDERGKNRLLIAARVLSKMVNHSKVFEGIRGDIQVWQISPDPQRLEARCTAGRFSIDRKIPI